MTLPKAKVTVTIDPVILARIKSEVEGGRAPSVSAYIEHSVANQLSAEEDFDSVLAEMLEATGGPLTDEEQAVARRILNGTAP